MKREQGFTLIELLIVVAIIGIIAAIAVPALLRSRISANESANISDLRALSTAEVAFASANGGVYGHITCLSAPAGCLPGYQGPIFMDSNMAQVTTTKSGFVRSFTPGATVASSASVAANSIADFTYTAAPSSAQTGTRAFAVDSRGRICFAGGSTPPVMSATATCNSIQ